jgi:hypothetical protein
MSGQIKNPTKQKKSPGRLPLRIYVGPKKIRAMLKAMEDGKQRILQAVHESTGESLNEIRRDLERLREQAELEGLKHAAVKRDKQILQDSIGEIERAIQRAKQIDAGRVSASPLHEPVRLSPDRREKIDEILKKPTSDALSRANVSPRAIDCWRLGKKGIRDWEIAAYFGFSHQMANRYRHDADREIARVRSVLPPPKLRRRQRDE